ncbi:hypothetical protein CBER1_06569 [Cercospora berteroae]|uniref:C2H2-type domain-containing protein n=1 Tax=Cercospora berteroae TaxID=357750 RepID=A0A2S6C3J9_9PEZI|nr:hypothetical protein CBER1_06569 [Cercospora berteroae]
MSLRNDSYRNERSFKCTDCPRGFNRRDLLLRHQAAHAKNAATGKIGPDRSNERAIKACDPCVISKLKCDNSRPCQRCEKRKIDCRTDSLDRDRSVKAPSVAAGENQQQQQQGTPSIPLPSPPDSASNNGFASLSSSENPATLESLPQLQDDSNWNLPDMAFPTFFDQIMAPDFVASDSMHLPLDIFNHMPEQDWLSDNMDIFGIDFTPTIDEAFDITNMLLIPQEQNEVSSTEQPGNVSQEQAAANSARQRHALFHRSPWLWKPEANSHAFSEHRSLPLDESEIDMSGSPHQPFLPSLHMRSELSTHSRDKIFQMVLKAAKSHVSIPRFPSVRPELLTALIAAGCVCFGIPSVSKTGLILFEIVRVALNRLVEDDNNVIRDLEYLQAYMMWIDVTAFCGYKRKMEIAEHSLQPLVTALRRAGKFDRVTYTSNQDAQTDEDNSLESNWKHWAKQESYKRLVHHLFEHDILTTITKVRNPLISYAEMTLPLPASRDQWLAPTAETWHMAGLEKTTRDAKHANLSLRDLLADGELLRCLPDDVDVSVARAAHLHGLAAQTWEHFQQSSVVNSPLASNSDPSGKLWLQTRHQQLYDTLQVIRSSIQDTSAVTRLLNEFLMMSMHVNPDDVTRFAGKCGEMEAHCAYQELQSWSHSKRARTAICHAAQVIRLAREVPPYQLRGADGFIISHAVMVLWAYGRMQRDLARRTRSSTPNPGSSLREQQDRENVTPVYLDAEQKAAIDAFLLMGTGRPCLRIRQVGSRKSHDGRQRSRQQQQCCDLRHAQAIMQVGVAVLEENYANEMRKTLPQLIRSLCELMHELGALA